MKLIYSRVRPEAKAPFKKYPEDAGWDVFACSDYVFRPGVRMEIPTGLAIMLQPTDRQREFAAANGLTWYWRAADKSGLATNLGVHILGGVVDRNFRGELKIIAANLGFFTPEGMLAYEPWTLRAGEKICQIVPELIADVREAEEGVLDATDRAGNGFGSTGST